MRIKIIMAVVVAIMISFGAAGQRLESYKSSLMVPDARTGARVEAIEAGDAAQAVSSAARRTSGDQKISGYRVRIFFDNAQNARQRANSTLSSFRELYPDIATYLTYENPYWKVTVGNCLTHEEAIVLWGRIKGTFDKAFVTREEIPLRVFGEEPEPVKELPGQE